MHNYIYNGFLSFKLSSHAILITTHQSSLRESVNAVSLRGPAMASLCLSSANRERDGIEGCSQ